MRTSPSRVAALAAIALSVPVLGLVASPADAASTTTNTSYTCSDGSQTFAAPTTIAARFADRAAAHSRTTVKTTQIRITLPSSYVDDYQALGAKSVTGTADEIRSGSAVVARNVALGTTRVPASGEIKIVGGAFSNQVKVGSAGSTYKVRVPEGITFTLKWTSRTTTYTSELTCARTKRAASVIGSIAVR